MGYLNILSFVLILTAANTQDVEIWSNLIENVNTALKVIEEDVLLMENKFRQQKEKVKIQLYYECLCPDCRQFDSKDFIHTYAHLVNYLEVHTYPYGNAQTTVHQDGSVEFICQHGPTECYGNMLHACAINIINNVTTSILFNSCMMDYSNAGAGSDDKAADKCGRIINVDTEPIKKCAKSKKGVDLLKYYGDESHKIEYTYVPFVLINGKEWNQDKDPNFMKAVCAAFVASVPPPCANEYTVEII